MVPILLLKPMNRNTCSLILHVLLLGMMGMISWQSTKVGSTLLQLADYAKMRKKQVSTLSSLRTVQF